MDFISSPVDKVSAAAGAPSFQLCSLCYKQASVPPFTPTVDIVSDPKAVATTYNNLSTPAQETAGSAIHAFIRGAAEKGERGFRRLLWRAGFL